MEWINSIPLPFEDPLCDGFFWEQAPDFGLNMPLPIVPGNSDFIPTTTPGGSPSTSPTYVPTATPEFTTVAPSTSSQEYESFYFSSDANYNFSSSDRTQINYHLSYMYDKAYQELDPQFVSSCVLMGTQQVSNEGGYYSYTTDQSATYSVDYPSSYAMHTYESESNRENVYIFDKSIDDGKTNSYYVMIDSVTNGNSTRNYDTRSNSVSFKEAAASSGYAEMYDPYSIMYNETRNMISSIIDDLSSKKNYYCEDILFVYINNKFNVVISYYDVLMPNVNLRLDVTMTDNYITYATYQQFEQTPTTGSEVEGHVCMITYSIGINENVNKVYPNAKGYSKANIFR